MFRYVIVFGVLLCVASRSYADINIEWVPVDHPVGVLDGYTTVDLFVHSDVGVCCAALLVELQQGEIFYFVIEDSNMNFIFEADTDKPPSQAIIDTIGTDPLFAPYAYTSYITLGGGQIFVPGGAGDVGGDGLAFTHNEIDVSWFGTQYPSGTLQMARLTLSNDSVGAWGFAVVGEGTGLLEVYGSVGELIPEPGTLALLAPGAWLCGWRDHRRCPAG